MVPSRPASARSLFLISRVLRVLNVEARVVRARRLRRRHCSQWRWRSEVRLAEPDQLQPEEPVPSAQARAALGSEGDLELLAQQEILEKEVVAASEGSGKRVARRGRRSSSIS